MDRVPKSRNKKVPRVKGVVPKQQKVIDRGYEVFTQESPRGSGSQKKSLEVFNGSSGWLFLFICFRMNSVFCFGIGIFNVGRFLFLLFIFVGKYYE